MTDRSPRSAKPVEGTGPSWKVILPFLIVTLIWGSTWIVIRDQLSGPPPAWSVTYRFAFACAFMFAYALATRATLRLSARDHLFALAMGTAQFVLNFNFVYLAIEHITSGLVGLMFALLVIPNALFARIFLGQRVSGGFLAGSAVAIAGVGLLFANEIARASVTGDGGEVALGVALGFTGVLAASVANVMQGSQRAKRLPMATLIAWGMFWGSLVDAGYAWAVAGPPVFDPRPAYWLGLAYLGLFASAVAFTLYFGLIRRIGPARAAYTGVLVPVIALVISTIFENYVWTWQAALGAALSLLGLVIALRARGQAPPPRVMQPPSAELSERSPAR